MTADPGAVSYPCPACGSTLYGWGAAHDPLDRRIEIVVDRCESCGLGVTRGPGSPDVEAEIEAILRQGADGGLELDSANFRSTQASLGGAQWAGLEPDQRRIHLTPEAVRLLLAQRGIEAVSVRTPFATQGHDAMRQTMLNAFTLRTNFLRSAREGRLPPAATGTERWARRLDWFVSYVVWVPCAIAAYPLERLAATRGRGGVLEVRARRVSGG